MADDSNLSAALSPNSDSAGPAAPAPAPDFGGGLPVGTDTSSNLGGAIQPSNPPPPGDLPRFQRTFKSTLHGILLGLEQGGIPGAVAGGVDPQAAQRRADARRQTMQAN